MNIIFLGPPGSGKGTQAKRLAEAHKIFHLSTGDLFREAIGAESALGQKIKAYVECGKLVPDDLVSEMVFEKVKVLKDQAGVLFDGYPRTIEQALSLDLFLKRESFLIDAVFFLDVKADDLVKRLSARRQCGACKEVFNLETKAPKLEGKCDVCSSPLTQRPDDRPDVVQERLRIYERQTEPILAHYKNGNNFYPIDGAQEIGRVYQSIEGALKTESVQPKR